MSITRDEWLKALEEALTTPTGDDGLTADELSSQSGCSVFVLRRKLRELQASGRLVVGRARRQSLDGRWLPVPVYRLKG